MSLPRVYAAINAVTAAFARHGIAKEHMNLADDYAYRSIDDVLNRLSPLLAEHRLCVLPRVLERSVAERQGIAGELLLSVSVRVAYPPQTHQLQVTSLELLWTRRPGYSPLSSGSSETVSVVKLVSRSLRLQTEGLLVPGEKPALGST